MIGFLPILSEREPRIGDEIVQAILYTTHRMGMRNVAIFTSCALRMRNALDELPNAKKVLATRKIMKGALRIAVFFFSPIVLAINFVSFVNLIKMRAMSPGITEIRNVVFRALSSDIVSRRR